MSNHPELFDSYFQFFDTLEGLYDRMDRAYGEIADQYGFRCSGCTDNCCLTRFFHHTLIEFLYLRKGFSSLEGHLQDEVRRRALEVNGEVEQAEDAGTVPRVMCPLNKKGLCILYKYRPMICRLHGIPHEFKHPVQNKVLGPGCDEFENQCGGAEYLAFDRTPFYLEMARLERRVREKTGITVKFKKTVAQMLVEDIGIFL